MVWWWLNWPTARNRHTLLVHLHKTCASRMHGEHCERSTDLALNTYAYSILTKSSNHCATSGPTFACTGALNIMFCTSATNNNSAVVLECDHPNTRHIIYTTHFVCSSWCPGVCIIISVWLSWCVSGSVDGTRPHLIVKPTACGTLDMLMLWISHNHANTCTFWAWINDNISWKDPSGGWITCTPASEHWTCVRNQKIQFYSFVHSGPNLISLLIYVQPAAPRRFANATGDTQTMRRERRRCVRCSVLKISAKRGRCAQFRRHNLRDGHTCNVHNL